MRKLLMAMLPLAVLTGCAAIDNVRGDGSYSSPERARMIAHGSDLMEFVGHLHVDPVGDISLRVEVRHPDRQPDRITAFILSNGVTVPAAAPSCDCVCDFSNTSGGGASRSGDQCEHTALYEVKLSRNWLERSQKSGLGVTVQYEDGARHEGPFIPPYDIRRAVNHGDPLAVLKRP